MTAPADSYVRTVARVKRVHDGDTYLLEIDQGMGDMREAWLRLRNFDTWELSQPLGPQARQVAEDALLHAGKITVQTFRRASGEYIVTFIRYVADVWVDDTPLAEVLRAAGMEKTV